MYLSNRGLLSLQPRSQGFSLGTRLLSQATLSWNQLCVYFLCSESAVNLACILQYLVACRLFQLLNTPTTFIMFRCSKYISTQHSGGNRFWFCL